jgi:hypothetical protein
MMQLPDLEPLGAVLWAAPVLLTPHLQGVGSAIRGVMEWWRRDNNRSLFKVGLLKDQCERVTLPNRASAQRCAPLRLYQTNIICLLDSRHS